MINYACLQLYCIFANIKDIKLLFEKKKSGEHSTEMQNALAPECIN